MLRVGAGGAGGQDGMFGAHLGVCSVGVGPGLWWPGGKKQWPLKRPFVFASGTVLRGCVDSLTN